MQQIRSFGVCSILAALIAAGGCTGDSPDLGDDGGGDDGGDPGDPGDPGGALTAPLFIERLITQECEKAFACKAEFPAAEGSFGDVWGTSITDCVKTDDDYVARMAIATSIAAGHIKYDAGIAANCLANLAFPAACPAFFTDYDWPDSCYDALAGQVADGGKCTTG